jgi:hypothetical protein
MAEHRRIWPLLVYGGLAAIASVLRKDTEPTAKSESYGAVRKPYRTTYPARDDNEPEFRRLRFGAEHGC